MTDSFPFYSLLFIFNNHYQICETLGSQRPSPGVFRTHRDTHAELSTRQISKVPIWSLSHFLQLFVALTEQRRMVDSFQQGHLTVYLPQWPALSLPAARIILESASRCMFVCVCGHWWHTHTVVLGCPQQQTVISMQRLPCRCWPFSSAALSLSVSVSAHPVSLHTPTAPTPPTHPSPYPTWTDTHSTLTLFCPRPMDRFSIYRTIRM